MIFEHARKSVAGTLAAIVLAASTASTQGCTSVTRKDIWKPEKEFSETLPAGESTQERLAYEISATHSARNAGTLEVVVQEAKYQEQYQNFQVVGKVRERKVVEETTKRLKKQWPIYTSLISAVIFGSSLYLYENYGEHCFDEDGYPGKGPKYTDCRTQPEGYVAAVGALGSLVGLFVGGMGLLVLTQSSSYSIYNSEHPTDELRISQKSQRAVANKTGQQTLYTAKPAANIELIAESDFYAVNGSGKTSVYTGADGRAKLLIGLPRGYVATEQELMQELMRRAEAGSMPLSEIRRYKTRAQVEHAIRLRTNAQPESGSTGNNAVDNAERTIMIPVYKLPE